MDDYDLLLTELNAYKINIGLELTQEQIDELAEEYEATDKYFDCGDLCWDSNLEELLVKHGYKEPDPEEDY